MLIVTYKTLVKCVFVNEDETFIFCSLPHPCRIWLLHLVHFQTWYLMAI